MKNFTLKRASEVGETYDLRTKYYFIGWIDLRPSLTIHSDIDYYFDTPECEYKRNELHERLERTLEISRSWPKYVWSENLKDLKRYLKTLKTL